MLRVSLVAVLILGGFGASAWHRINLPEASRELELDEWVSMTQSTWVGLEPTGEMREVRSTHVLNATPPPTTGRLALGLYTAVGRWQEPNNHVVHSLTMNLAYALFGASERSGRVGALVGGLVFAVAVFWMARTVFDLGPMAYAAAAWAWFIPYSFRFSLTARGYTWMVALAVLLVHAAHVAFQKPHDVRRHAWMAVLGVASAINIVSMAADWLVPLYVTLFIAGGGAAPAAAIDHMSVWRRALVAQAVVVFAVIGLFYLPHLPNLAASASQYGVFVDSWSSFLQALGSAVAYLFEGRGWWAFAGVGVAGLVVGLTGRTYRWIGLFGLTVLALNITLYAAAGRLPYDRTMGHWVVVAILGVATLLASINGRLMSVRGRVTTLGVVSALTALLLVTTRQPALLHPTLRSMVALTTAIDDPSAGRTTVVPRYTSDDLAIEFNAPASRHSVPQLCRGDGGPLAVRRHSSRARPQGYHQTARRPHPRGRCRRAHFGRVLRGVVLRSQANGSRVCPPVRAPRLKRSGLLVPVPACASEVPQSRSA
jgi:hypothetical protein